MGNIMHTSAKHGWLAMGLATWLLPVAAMATVAPPAAQIAASQQPVVLVDQVGYDTAAPKHAILQGIAGDRFTAFNVIDVGTGKVALRGVPAQAGQVDHWNDWHYWTLDFSALQTPGRYRIAVDGNVSAASLPFRVTSDVLKRYTLSNVLYYFKGQRVSGAMDKADAHLKNPDPHGPAHVDLHGGWYAATGDYGVHLAEAKSQEVPLVVWSLIGAWRNLSATGSQNYAQYDRRLLDEATYGADFLVRSHVAGGSFYQSISAPGVAKAPADRRIGATNFVQVIKTKPGSAGSSATGAARWPQDYVTSFGSGGGMAIAALAAASTLPAHGDYSSQRYLAVAEDAFRYLQQHNAELVRGDSDGIMQDYGALLAATELYRATHAVSWQQAADHWADQLMARQISNASQKNYWRAGVDNDPFFNATDEGLPIVALVEYAAVATPAQKAKAVTVIRNALAFQMRITGDTNNPFGYAREYVRLKNGATAVRFFFPHGVMGTWWQGEDARLASLAAAARAASPLFADDPAFQSQLQDYAWNQLHWILGRNPYDTSMLMGSGDQNGEYMYFKSWEYTNAPGAIINGITSGLNDADEGIAFDLGYAETGKDDDWRWTEQWLPHAAWYLYAVSLPHR